MLASLSLEASQIVEPQYDISDYTPAQQYLSQAINIEIEQKISEGTLAYANMIAQGSNISVVSNQYGFAIFELQEGKYTLVSDVRMQDLGLQQQNSLELAIVSPTDNWIILKSNSQLISVPLNAQHKPIVENITTVNAVYGAISLSKQLLVVNSNYTIATFAISPETGSLTLLNNLGQTNYSYHVAVTDDTLIVARQGWVDSEENLSVYRLVNNNWQYSSGHKMHHNEYGYYSVGYLAVNPSGNRIIYGDSSFSYMLNLQNGTLTEDVSGEMLFGKYVYNLFYANDDAILIRDNESIALHNSVTLQEKANFDINLSIGSLQDFSVGTKGISLLGENGIVHLDNETLKQDASIQPGAQDIVFDFGQPQTIAALGNDYLISKNNSVIRVFKLNENGTPELVQTAKAIDLLGFENYYSELTSVDLGNGRFLLATGYRYSIVELDTQTSLLRLIRSDIVVGYKDYGVYLEKRNTVRVGDHIIVSQGDTINRFKLNSNNQLIFVDAVVNGVSGVSGISNIDMLVTAEGKIYAINAQQQVISQFSIANNLLKQTKIYENFSLAYPNNYYLRGSLLTFISNNFLQSFKIADNGELTLLSSQYTEVSNTDFVAVGQRFIAFKNRQELSVFEQDNTTGIWSKSLDLNQTQLGENDLFYSSSLLPLAGNIGLYDSNKHQFMLFKYNSAPFVYDSSKLKKIFNQGKSDEFQIVDIIKDEENDSISFSLQNTSDAFTISDEGLLHLNGQIDSAGTISIIASDSKGLMSEVTIQYDVNLAPIAKTGSPRFTIMQEDNIQLELAQHFIDPEGQALYFTLSTAHAGISLSSTGLLTGQLDAVGDVTLNIMVTDSAGAVAQQSISISVTEKPKKSSGGSLSYWLILVGGLCGLIRFKSV